MNEPMRRTLTGFVLCALTWASGLHGQAFSVDEPKHDGSSQELCTNVGVETSVLFSPESAFVSGVDSNNRERWDFTIVVLVTNPCREPLELFYGSFVRYRTNFPLTVGNASNGTECIRRRLSLMGHIGPRQQVPFAFEINGCLVPSNESEQRSITLDGNLLTSHGPRPIASLVKRLP